MSEILATYVLQVLGPEPHEVDGVWRPYDLAREPFSWWLRETEENLTDLLPEGFSVRIREWNEEVDDG